MNKSDNNVQKRENTLFASFKWQPHPKYKANSARTSHIAVWERDFNSSLEDEWGRVAEWR